MRDAIQHDASSVLIIVPVYNEALNLSSLLENILSETHFDVIVIDDNSSDESIETALERGVPVLPLSARLGAWGAVQTGIRYGLKHNYNTFITMDGDGQHHPRDITSLLKAMDDSSVDMVIGSCPGRGSAARHVAWWIFRGLSGLNLRDLTSGFKVFKRKTAVYLAQPKASIFDYQDIGVILYLLQNSILIGEKSVRMAPRGDGKSRIFSSWPQVIKYMLQTIVLCLSMRVFRKPICKKNTRYHNN
ncbi:MAG: glycosyltransferase family 2 protein [Deltaproteobacteria bacterium]|nr:glycosyltransferase family 2 protein [Deltaproteobacteria bacterium]